MGQPCAHHKRSEMGKHFNTKHSIEKIKQCRKLLQQGMKAKEVAVIQEIPYATMMRKLEEYNE